ncbi:histidine phosphatase family protein [Microtetraspora sp. AC03309]|uniref:SixA phosphatase family protein n=1 Tax=Microtetraspora sp. AC03309 TaxID=2779376 RepID=UPI001E449BD4|nr:histidine phosphatase family protein [Microtetraspora sp. AC03309]MCC5581875.1 histidine phosphatase family protein [Microtetraspora sp. AC03309]
MKTLIVVRHATAAQVPGLADRERPLTEHGRREARDAGDLIRPLKPGLVLCSPSVRTRETAELLGIDAPIEVERDIYEAYADELLDLLRRTGPEIETLVLVGHNPGVHELVLTITGDGNAGFPPGAYAVIELPGDWDDLDPGTGNLVRAHRP